MQGTRLAPPGAPPLKEVQEYVKAAAATGDWLEIIKWKGRMEELLENQSAAASHTILYYFKQAHLMCWVDSKKDDAGKEHGRTYVRLEERRIDILDKMGSFRESALALIELANTLLLIEADGEKASRFLRRAREIGAAHGFLEVECRACQGLGQRAVLQGQYQDAVQLLRDALKISRKCLKDLDGPWFLNLLESFTYALFKTTAIEEVAPLVQLYREAANAESRKTGQLSYYELLSLRASARLHKV
jgi:hypothetical protein